MKFGFLSQFKQRLMRLFPWFKGEVTFRPKRYSKIAWSYWRVGKPTAALQLMEGWL